MKEEDKDKFKKKIDDKVQQTSPQLQLHLPITFFQTDKGRHLDELSNLYHLFDSFPIYSSTKREMADLRRKEGDILPFLEKEFSIYGDSGIETVKFTIVPAIVEEKIKGKKKRSSHYPSAEDQLVEQALRKILFSQKKNKHFSDKSLVVYFTIDEIEKELKALGRSRNHPQIKKSLDILSGAFITLEYGKHGFYKEPILTYGRHAETGTYYATFASMVEQSIRNLDYRQFHLKLVYGKKDKTPLASWLATQLFIQFTNADVGKSMKMTLTQIRDTSLLFKSDEVKQQLRILRHALSQITAEQGNKDAKAQEDINRFLKINSKPRYIDCPLNHYRLEKIDNEWILEMFPSDFFIDQMIKSNIQRKKLNDKDK